MISLSTVQLNAWIAAFFFPLARILAMLAAAPPFSNPGLTTRVRLILGMAITIAVTPALPSMHAIFIANGPSFLRGVVLPAFDNVDVYPLLAKLSGVTPAPNDGNPHTLLPALKRP